MARENKGPTLPPIWWRPLHFRGLVESHLPLSPGSRTADALPRVLEEQGWSLQPPIRWKQLWLGDRGVSIGRAASVTLGTTSSSFPKCWDQASRRRSPQGARDGGESGHSPGTPGSSTGDGAPTRQGLSSPSSACPRSLPTFRPAARAGLYFSHLSFLTSKGGTRRIPFLGVPEGSGELKHTWLPSQGLAQCAWNGSVFLLHITY